MLLLLDKDIEFESVFVNHGADYPETYEYVDYLKREGFEITVITPPLYCGCTTIEQYTRKYKFYPGVFARWCTAHFKVIPFLKYIETPAIVYIGYGYDEKQRAERRKKRYKKENDVFYEYPLISARMNRKDCIAIINEHNLRVPIRSTCYFCPFQTDKQIRDLYKHHYDLYKCVVELETICSSKGKKFTFRKGKSISEIVVEDNIKNGNQITFNNFLK